MGAYYRSRLILRFRGQAQVSARLPSPPEVETVKYWLHESTGLPIDGIRFARNSSGLFLRVDYRDVKGHSQKQTLTAPDTDDFTELAVEMSNILEVREFGSRKRVIQ